MLSELKAYADKLRQETLEESSASPDRYPFEMPQYVPPEEVRELGRVQVETQKIAKAQFLQSSIKFQ
jgi:hypothetical protein